MDEKPVKAYAPATRSDVEEIVTQVVQEAMGVIATHFDKVGDRFDSIETDISDLQVGQARIERKLDSTINRLDDLGSKVNAHSRQLKKLQPRLV